MQLSIFHLFPPKSSSAQRPAIPMHKDNKRADSTPTTQQLLPAEVERLRLRMVALSRWDNEGGAVPGVLPAAVVVGTTLDDDPNSAESEAVQMRIRVIALENLVIAILAQASEAHLDLAREMAAYISPRPGFTPHHLTLRAADEMRSLVDRACHFRNLPSA